MIAVKVCQMFRLLGDYVNVAGGCRGRTHRAVFAGFSRWLCRRRGIPR